MATVKAPNGTVMELPDSIASGLVASDDGWSLTDAEAKPATPAKPKTATK